MGLWPRYEFLAQRYEYVCGYATALRWPRPAGQFDLHGLFFDLDDCVCIRRPSRDIAAAASDWGPQFAAVPRDHIVTVIQRGLEGVSARLGLRTSSPISKL